MPKNDNAYNFPKDVANEMSTKEDPISGILLKSSKKLYFLTCSCGHKEIVDKIVNICPNCNGKINVAFCWRKKDLSENSFNNPTELEYSHCQDPKTRDCFLDKVVKQLKYDSVTQKYYFQKEKIVSLKLSTDPELTLITTPPSLGYNISTQEICKLMDFAHINEIYQNILCSANAFVNITSINKIAHLMFLNKTLFTLENCEKYGTLFCWALSGTLSPSSIFGDTMSDFCNYMHLSKKTESWILNCCEKKLCLEPYQIDINFFNSIFDNPMPYQEYFLDLFLRGTLSLSGFQRIYILYWNLKNEKNLNFAVHIKNVKAFNSDYSYIYETTKPFCSENGILFNFPKEYANVFAEYCHMYINRYEEYDKVFLWRCYHLTKFSIPISVETIEDKAFFSELNSRSISYSGIESLRENFRDNPLEFLKNMK